MPKDIRHLSKRRINQYVQKRIVQYIKNTQHASSNCNDIMMSKSLIVSNSEPTCSTDTIGGSQSPVPTTGSLDSSVIDFSQEIVPNSIDHNTLSSSLESSDNESNFTSTESCEVNLEDLLTQLRRWVIKYQIQRTALEELLKILRILGHDVPQTARSLMSTPRNATSEIENIAGGLYYHFGLVEGLQRSIQKYFKDCPAVVEININCDGMSISNSSSSQFWPILGSIEIDRLTEPFVIGLYHGSSKPKDANMFFKKLINEASQVLANGIVINEDTCNVRIKAIVCDAPAKSFLTYTKGHNGYFGCSKCIQEGEWHGRLIYPEIRSTLRTDADFSSMRQPEHHIGKSDFCELDIGLVSQIAIDYMHLVCLGVVKRLVQFWVKGPKNIRLPDAKLESLCKALVAMRVEITNEFARKPRTLRDIDRWKATECRQFLLYTGPVILKSILSETYYCHFLALSIAIRILSNSHMCLTLNEYAQSLLEWFVTNYKELYGIEYITHNVHNLVHLANDVKQFGCLDKFSAFKFESFMSRLKRKVKNSGRPLQQVVNRVMEENAQPIKSSYPKSYPIVHRSKNLPTIETVEYPGFSISIKKNENCCLLDDQSIFLIDFIFKKNKIIYMKGVRVITTTSLFFSPCDSKKLNISIIDDKSIIEPATIPVKLVQTKCLRLQQFGQNNCTVIPLLQYNY